MSRLVACLLSLLLTTAFASSDQTSVAVEALLRLNPEQVEQNAKLKETLSRLLTRTPGTAEFVRLVQHFNIQGENSGLLEAASQNPSADFGVEAMKLILGSNETNLVVATLNSTNSTTVSNCVQVLGNTRLKEAIHFLVPLLSDSSREVPLRRHVTRTLAQSLEGAKALLDLAEQQQLPDAVKFVASSELSRAPWPEIQAKAKQLLPLPAGQNSRPLPPIAELVKMKGDPKNGEHIFQSPGAACATCHRVRGQGIDFGPDLTEIGSKLAKEALHESILDPSAGISFGYEPWQITLKSGDEVYGLIVSETPDEIAVKTPGGIVSKYKPSEIATRQRGTLSIMPAGLQQNMTTQDLVDLVEYLASLKKAGT